MPPFLVIFLAKKERTKVMHRHCGDSPWQRVVSQASDKMCSLLIDPLVILDEHPDAGYAMLADPIGSSFCAGAIPLGSSSQLRLALHYCPDELGLFPLPTRRGIAQRIENGWCTLQGSVSEIFFFSRADTGASPCILLTVSSILTSQPASIEVLVDLQNLLATGQEPLAAALTVVGTHATVTGLLRCAPSSTSVGTVLILTAFCAAVSSAPTVPITTTLSSRAFLFSSDTEREAFLGSTEMWNSFSALGDVFTCGWSSPRQTNKEDWIASLLTLMSSFLPGASIRCVLSLRSSRSLQAALFAIAETTNTIVPLTPTAVNLLPFISLESFPPILYHGATNESGAKKCESVRTGILTSAHRKLLFVGNLSSIPASHVKILSQLDKPEINVKRECHAPVRCLAEFSLLAFILDSNASNAGGPLPAFVHTCDIVLTDGTVRSSGAPAQHPSRNHCSDFDHFCGILESVKNRLLRGHIQMVPELQDGSFPAQLLQSYYMACRQLDASATAALMSKLLRISFVHAFARSHFADPSMSMQANSPEILVVDVLVAIALSDESVFSRTGCLPLGVRFFDVCFDEGFDVSEFANALAQHCSQYTI